MMIILIFAASLFQVAFCQYSDDAYTKTGVATQGYDPTNEFPVSDDEESGDDQEEKDDYNYDEYEYGDYNYEDYDYYEESGNLDYSYNNYYDYQYIQEGELETFIANLNCEVKLGVELQEGDLQTSDNGTEISVEANSFRDCAIICGMDPDCGKYTYINQGGENTGCYLKKSSNYTSITNAYAVSGDGCLEAVYPQEE